MLGQGAYVLACAAGLAAAVLKRLSMFVLRARCQLSDVSATHAVHGALGATALRWSGAAPAWSHLELGAATVLRLPDVRGVARCMVVGSGLPGLDQAPAVPRQIWQRLEVQSGVPTVESATVDQFVPQMLNYELIGGIDFKKGCYPGQEVVARSHYRGTLKRRMFLFELEAPAHAGQEVYHSADPAQPAGMVVNAAEDAGATWALCEVKLEALGGGSLHLGAPQGPVLRLDTLPYDVALPVSGTH